MTELSVVVASNFSNYTHYIRSTEFNEYYPRPNRQEVTFRRLFRLVKDRMPLWQPKKFEIDFEIAVIRKTFPNVITKE